MIYSLKKLLKSNYLFTLGIVICLGWILAAVFAPVIAPYDPITQDLTRSVCRLRPQSIGSERIISAAISSAV